MKNLIDIHTHSLASGHAYSTLQENVFEARKKGLVYYGLSDHGPAMPGGPHPYFISNMRIIPETIEGVRILKGVELNIMDAKGTFDVEQDDLMNLDYAIASLHIPTFKPQDCQTNTQACIEAMKSPFVKVLGHPDDSRFPLDYRVLVEAAKQTHTLIEINNSSLSPNTFRLGAKDNYLKLLTLCAELQVPILCNTDAHISFLVGDINRATELLDEAKFPYSLIVNYSHDLIQEYILKPKPSLK